MASAKKVTEKRHNPVESICRKIRAIQKREISHPIRHIVRYQSSSFDSPQTNPKKDLEEVLRRMIAAHVPPPNTLSSSSERGEAFISPPHIASPGDPTSSHPGSPESAAHSAILTREGVTRGSCSGIDDSAFEQDSINSGRGIKMTTDSTDFASRSFEALGGDVSNQVLEVSDLITYVTDLHFNKQKLEEENNKFKLALETLEEANSQLSQDCTELHLQIKSAHQAIMRTNLLKEELEELKICMSASEEQKTMVIAQNKQLKDLSIEELKSTIIEHGRIIEGLRGDKNRLAHELQRLQQELIMQKQLEAITQLQEDAVSQEAIFRKKVQEASQWLEDAEKQVEDGDRAAHSASEKAKPLRHKLEEAISEQRNRQTINTELVNSCQTLEQKTRKPKNALHLDRLTGVPRLELTPFPRVANQIHASCERSKYGEIEDGALDVTERQNVHAVRFFLMVDSGSEILNMASADLGCKPLGEKEEEKRSVSAGLKSGGRSPAPENIVVQGSVSEGKTTLNLEAIAEPGTREEHRKECAAGDAALSSLPVTTVKSVNFRQSDNISTNEKEVEAEFLRLSLGFKCDWFTLEKRVKLEERSRDLAEENLKKEITNCLKLLESLTPLCEDDSQAQEIIKKLEKSITFLSQCTARVASRAEMLGAINQESRVSKAVEVMIQHVENLKRMYAKEHAELEELKQVLLQNERSFNPLEDEDDCQIKKRSASLNSKKQEQGSGYDRGNRVLQSICAKLKAAERQNPINGVESMGNIKVTAPAKPSKCLDEDSSDDDKCHVANGGVCED
ncbi:hypothetical protein CB1_000743153 [Camelus ferus]|nr:hypothetical protein CB1_000743153 [Camelus ferus]